MRKIVFSMALAALLCFLVPAYTATPPTPAVKKADIRRSIQSAGFYDVLVLKGGQWQQVGMLRYGSHFRDRQIDLGPFLGIENKVKVRLFQNGGGAAHIDTVLLGNRSPSAVEGCSNPLALKKLLKKDFDVIDAYHKTLDLTFDSKGENKTLAVTARIEPAAISKIPFQFPQHNLFRSITAGSHFYPYKLKPKNDPATDKTAISPDKSFLKEYCLTGSGHPSGFTYGWVTNDEKNLYVKLDFTPDNTRDGNKDYAKLYVRKGGDLAEFKVSEESTRWGKPEFTYTDKAAYQHKVYHFTIPLETLNIEQPVAVENIDLAFAAYGTASPAYLATDTAYDEEYRRYLIVYVNNLGYVTGQMVDENGSLYGSELSISENPNCYYPSIVHNAVNANFLVLFEGSATHAGIYGQIVVPNGTLSGGNSLISEPVALNPVNAKGAHDPIYNQFLVVWEDERSQVLNKDIYGQVLDGSTLSPLDVNFPVMVAAGNQYDPAIAYDGYNEKYLAVFTDTRNGDYWDIYGRVIDYDGAINGSDFAISSNLGIRQRDPAIAFDPVNNLFSVVWEHGDPAPENIFGKFVIIRPATYTNGFYSLIRPAAPCFRDTTNGCTVLGLEGDFAVSTAINLQQNPYIIHDNSEFLAVWDDMRSWSPYRRDIYGRSIGVNNPTDLTPDLTASEMTVVTSTDDESDPSLAYNPRLDDTLLAYRNYTPPADTYEYLIFGAGGTVTGTVSDRVTTLGVESAAVGAINDDTEVPVWQYTDSNGDYTIDNLAPGCYTIVVYPDSLSDYQSPYQIHVNLADGETEIIDFELDTANFYTVSGQVTIAGGQVLDNARVTIWNGKRRFYRQTSTAGGGYYQFDRVPHGEIEFTVEPMSALTDVEFFGANATLPEIGSPVTHTKDFTIPVNDACVSGEVRDESNNTLPGSTVYFESELHNFDRNVVAGALGDFTICGLPPGVGHIGVEPLGGSSYCEPSDVPVFLEEDQTRDIGVVTARSCAPVNGMLIANDPDDLCWLEIGASGDGFSEDDEPGGDIYTIGLPAGTHLIYLESYGETFEQIVATPVAVTVTADDVALGTPVQAPDMQVISASHPSGAVVEGTVQKTAVIPNPTGQMGVMVFLPGQLDDITPASVHGVSTTQQIALREFGAAPDSIPYNGILPAGTWDVFWVVQNESEAGIESITILNASKGVAASAAAPAVANFVYNAQGSPIVSGKVRDAQNGDPILGARVLITDGSNNLAAFAETDEKGDWVVYNLPAGNYTATAGHDTYTGSPTTPITAADGSDFTAEPLELTAPASGTTGISGTVMDDGLPPAPITADRIQVTAISGDPCGNWGQTYSTQTETDGTYIISGLPPGQYYLRTDNMWQSNYVNEWYSSGGSVVECTSAGYIEVVAEEVAPDNDFQLDSGVEVSGTVYHDDGTTPITDVHINVTAFRVNNNDPCQGNTWSVGTQTNMANGSFTLKGVPVGTGSVYLNTGNMNQSNYVNEWWRNIAAGSTSDCSQAELLDVPAGGVIGLSFQLDLGGSTSGYVTDGALNPIENLWVHAFDSRCGGQWFGGSNTDETGYYKIWGIPESGDVFVQACADCSGLGWVDEWWDGDINSGSIDCNGAAPISITPGADSGGISFKLASGGSISGHIEDSLNNPIINLNVSAHDYYTGEFHGNANTNTSGDYTIVGLPSGDYQLRTCSDCSGLQYADEYYDNAYNWEGSTPVNVIAPGETPDKDFILEAGNTISGTITGLSADQYIHITARSDNGTSYISSDDLVFWAGINGSGTGTDDFTINALPGYFYRVEFSPNDGLFVYYKTGEIYGTWDWNQATRINVTENVTGINVAVQDDTDGDQMPDDWENDFLGGMSRDGNGDLDGDGLNDRDEYRNGTLPNNPDSDGDKISDAYELNWGSDPTQAADAPPIPIIGVIINIHKPGGVIETSVEVLVENGFVGTLPDDIDTITITGPGLSLTKGDLEFLSEWNEWATNLPGSPQLGQYTFTVTSGSASGTAYDTLTVNRTIPLADHTEFNPPDGATITSPAPTFSWEAVNYSEATMYYRLEIRDLSDVRAYASGRVARMLSHAVPAGNLNPGQQYKWRVRVGDSPTWEGEQNRSNSEWIYFTMGTTLSNTATPGLDIRDKKSGALIWTSNHDNPSTSLWHEVMVVDYDGIAADGSSHTVTVTYPNGGPTKTLNFDSRRDAHTAYYSYGDGNIPQPIPSSYNGDYVYSVEDAEGNSSQAIDNLVANAINPPDEKAFTPNFSSPQHIEAYFDNVQVNGSPYEDFEAGTFNPDRWEWQPAEVSYVGGEAKFERTWYPSSQSIGMNLKNPIGVTGFKANARVKNITYDSTKGSVYARLAGRFCMDSRGEVHARVGIRGDEAVYTVYTEFWEGDHLIEIPLISSGYLGPVTQGNNYELTLDWNETTKTISFRVVGPHAAGTIDYARTYTVTDYSGQAPNPYRQLSIVGWVGVDTTTPTFNWGPVSGATHYRIRLYGLNDNHIYWGQAKSPPYTLPPGIIKPGGLYKYRIYARREHQWMEWDNASANDRDQAMFYVDYVEAQDPYVDVHSLGVYTWNHQPPFAEYPHFYVRVHDAQGVPNNIETATVTVPGGDTINLYYDQYITPTEGLYRGTYFGAIPSVPSVYSFAVTDKDGNGDTATDTLTPETVAYRERSELLPLHNTLIGGTGVTLDWEPPAGATNYFVKVYDKDGNRLFGLHTDEDQFVIPPGILKENELYQYQLENWDRYPEDNMNSGSSSPPGGLWNAPTFTTTAASGTSNPAISLGDFGVAVWQAPHPATGAPYYELNLYALVSDPDGVPQNIARVEVKFPDGTIHQLKYADSPNFGANYIHYIQLADTSSILDQSKPGGGIYEFKVVDREGNEATVQDILPDVNAATGVIDWPTNVAPVDGTVVTTTTPTITWSTVPGASYYKVRIMSAYDHPTVHWSGEVTGTQYTVPEGLLFNGDTHGYRVYAYREPSGSEIDFYSCYSSWHATNNHFTINLADSDGDGVFDEDDNCPDDYNPLQEDNDADDLGNACDNCPDDYNPNQENLDGDLLGDICDDDADGDGYIDENLGGDDCDDLNDTVYPGAPEIPGDGIDQDCDGSDTIDITPGDYFVDPAAGTDDQSHGTSGGSSAWKSLHYAALLINQGTPGAYTLTLAPVNTYTFTTEGIDEPLYFEQDVTIDGQGSTLDGTGDHSGAENPWTTGLMVGMGAVKVTIENLTIQNFKAGVSVQSDGGCVILNNVTLTSNEAGLQLAEAYQVDVDLGGNTISGNTTGIEVTGASSNNTIRNGTVSGNSGDGILFEASNVAPASNLVTGVTISNNAKDGVAFLAGDDNEVSDCDILNNNTGANPWGHTGSGGVHISSGTARVKWNTIKNNSCSGVFAEETTTSEIHGNLISRNQDGITLSFTSGVTVQNNTITENNNTGLTIKDGSKPIVLCNILWGNGGDYDLMVAGDYTTIEFNDVGSMDMSNLPPNNITVNPQFTNAGAEDYTLQYTSFCIDGTDITEGGRDIAGEPRPKGLSWDIGAYESLGYADPGGNGIPDWWEQKYFGEPGVNPDGDPDGDGKTNLQEYEDGTDPTTAVAVSITDPPKDEPGVAYSHHNTSAITVSGTSEAAASVDIVVNAGSPITVPVGSGGDWSAAGVPMSPGQNLILVTANPANASDDPTTAKITVIRDAQDPVVTVQDPVYAGYYPIVESEIHISGIAYDDTRVAAVRWSSLSQSGVTRNGDAIGTGSWDTGPIPLEEDETHDITITVEDIFGKIGTVMVYVEQETGVSEVAAPEPEPVYADPRDLDEDKYLNEDESACLGNDSPAPRDPALYPQNVGNTMYPTDTNHPNYNINKVGYFWPDCLNPDDDEDGLPDWWEQSYFGNTTAAIPTGTGSDPDNDGINNQTEFENGTDPTVAQGTNFILNLYDGSGADVTESFLPEYMKAVRVVATWDGDVLSSPTSADFKLVNTSNYAGRAINDPDPAIVQGLQYPAGYDYTGPDFGLTETDPFPVPTQFSYEQGSINVSRVINGQIATYTIYLVCWDYAARTRLEVNPVGIPAQIDAIWVPKGSGINTIAKAWDYDGNPATDTNALESNGDIDKLKFETDGEYEQTAGDGLNNFEEYRGIIYIAAGNTTIEHRRLNPLHKDLFLRSTGFDDATGDPYDAPAAGAEDPFVLGLAFKNANIDVHNTTGWGHDATADNSFFIYYEAGDISSINHRIVTGFNTQWLQNWPRWEWEFKLLNDPGDEADPALNAWMPIQEFKSNGELALLFDYVGESGDFTGNYRSYLIRRPLPNISVLIVRNEYNQKAVLSSGDGHIRFGSSTLPDNENQHGARHWYWSTKGLGKSNEFVANYGLAVSMKTPTDHYVYDRPYKKGTMWNSSTCSWRDPVGNEVDELSPLNTVEDYTDLMQPADGALLCDTENGEWDGDHRLATTAEWLAEGTLSPYDIDGDGLIEQPTAATPAGIVNEYEKWQILRHTLTHEVAHALGIASHSEDPDGVMFMYSRNWHRQDRISDWFLSTISIYNAKR